MAELAASVRPPGVAAPGLVLADMLAADAATAMPDPVFARQLLPDARVVNGPSVSALAEAVYTVLESAIDRGDGPFTLHAYAVRTEAGDDGGLGSRVELVGRQTLVLLQKRRRRAFARFLSPEAFAAAAIAAVPSPASGPDLTLLQVVAIDRTSVVASAASPAPRERGGLTLAPWPAGLAPVTVDRAPPSRAYQKLEEAFLWMSAAPTAGDVCVDLGASPGGWTMTALKRGAHVTAVDRAPLEAPAAPHPRLTMSIGNAFTYEPPHPVDWLLCDVICEPQRTIALIKTWLARRWCSHLVCTVKFKGRAGYSVLAPLPALLADAGLRFARVKQLGHNKNEVTVMGIR